jgi:chloride channel protein, CIC family
MIKLPGVGFLESLRQRLSAWRASLLRLEFRFVPSENQRLFALTLIIGVVCGLAAVAFHLSIRFLEHKGIDRAEDLSTLGRIALLLALPTAGALVSGVLLQYVVPAARGSGIPQVKIAYGSPGGQVRLRDAVGKFAIGVVQIGSGGSLGREGPTVHICAGIASTLGRLFGLSAQNLRRLLPVGAAAGIAAAFNAPIAAVTFTIEEVVGTLDQTVLSGVVIAAALASVIERSVLGANPVFDVPPGYGLNDARSLVLYAAMGVAAAGVSVLFTDMLLGIRQRCKELTKVPLWAQPAVGGLVTGALAALVLEFLGTKGVTGGGYATLGQALLGKLPVFTLLALVFAKLVATAFSYGTGGAGGIFAPALFMGSMLGGVFGAMDIGVLHSSPQSLGAFSLVGMGAVFAGVIRAPITSVLIIIEMTGGYGLILPLMIANMTAYVLAARLRPTPIYEALLEQDGVFLRHHQLLDALDGVLIKDSMAVGVATSFVPATGATELLRRFKERPIGQMVFPVLDDREQLVGIVTSDDLDLLAHETDLGSLVTASDLMRTAVSVRAEDNLRTAFEMMRTEGVPQVPVVDLAGRFVGFIDEATIAREYLQKNVGQQDEKGGRRVS